MDIVTVPTVRNLHSALNPAIKSLNYLNNILAKIEANNAGVRGGGDAERRRFRGRMHGRQSVHREKRRAVHAAAVGGRALRHHARAWSWNWPRRSGLKVSEPNLTRYDLFNADECFLTGTGAEIMPVVKIDGRVIGTGKPGPSRASWMEEYHALTQVLRRADIQVT